MASLASGEPATVGPCKFFASGSCNLGARCKYVHDVKNMAVADKAKTICKFFLEGRCTNGKRCPFAHKNRKKANPPSSSTGPLSSFAKLGRAVPKPSAPSAKPWSGVAKTTAVVTNCSASQPVPAAATTPKWDDGDDDDFFFYGAVDQFSKMETAVPHTAAARESSALSYSKLIERELGERNETMAGKSRDQAMKPDASICPFHKQGYCRFGKSCKLVHAGTDEKTVEEKEVEESRELECGICFSRVLEKSSRFGLLLGCNHSFCLDCIRSWRQNETSQFNIEAVRRCPICRVPSYFIVPSNRLLLEPSRKREVVNEYLRNMRSKACRYFKEQGSCPFGTSCFYGHFDAKTGKHIGYEPPRLTVGEDGQVRGVSTPLLSEFLFSQ